MLLLNKIAQFANLFTAFKACSRGKRQKVGFQNFLFNYGERLKLIEHELLKTQTFKWGHYREFEVYDPKRRLITAAPFQDRVVHTAIHQIINPLIDSTLGQYTYACRKNMGNRNAVLKLFNFLQQVKHNRYCIKLDVKKYFANIDHAILLDQLSAILPDNSIQYLLRDLVKSHPQLAQDEKGIPIGNLTSQLFANLYLSPLDKLACRLLQLDFNNPSNESNNFYIRYMDDLVIITPDKQKTFHCANLLVDFAQQKLKLSIPNYKKVILSNDPIPFLGFVLDHQGYRVLSRNKRKFTRKIVRANKNNINFSHIALMNQSYQAWRSL